MFPVSKRWLYPLIIIIAAYAVASVIRSTGPEVETVVPPRHVQGVRVVQPVAEQVQLQVESQGEVSAEFRIDLSAEVDGRIIAVSPAFVSGGYFEKDQVLIELDPKNYELVRVRAEAKLIEAIEDLELEQVEAKLAKDGLFPLRDARVQSSEARVASAKAELAQAEVDLQRTKIRAPFAGRVLFNSAGLGQYISRGESLGQIFSTDIFEVRLPLSDRQLQYLEFPFGLKPGQPLPAIEVELQAELAGEIHTFSAYLHRMDGALDPDNRVWYAVARIDDPYHLQQADDSPPLVLGTFVKALISGKTVNQVYKLPRSALREGGYVYVVDDQQALQKRPVSVLKTDFNHVFISQGITEQDKVCVSAIEVFRDGMPVAIKQQTALSEGQP